MRKFNLVQRFSILSFLLIFVITLVGSIVILSYIKKIMIKNEALVTSHFLRVEIKRHFLLKNFQKKGFSEEFFHFRMFLTQLLTYSNLVGIKMYDTEGIVLWSDQQDVVGKKFNPNKELTKALHGKISSTLGVPHETEHIPLRKYQQIMEIYTPVFDMDSKELLGVIGTYKQPQILLASISRTQKLIWIMALLGGSSLYLGLFGIVYNSHKKQMRLEEDVKKSHERYMDLIENSPEMIHQVDMERTFLHVNKTETERLGFALEEMKGMKLEDLTPLERKEELLPHFNRVLSDGESTIETTFRTKDGEDIEVEINETGFFDQKTGTLIHSRAFIRDITKRKEAQREIQFLNEYYEAILGSMNSYVRVINSKRIVEFENHLITKQFGENIGSECNAFWRAGQQCQNCITNLTLTYGKTYTSEEKTSDGRFYSLTSIPMKSRDGSISAIEIISDITNRKKLEQEIIQQEKMAGVGLLAAGLAHEIGNPIGIVDSAVQFCLQKLNPEGSLKEHLEVIQRNIYAADHTIKELLRFARPAESEYSRINVIELLKEACSIVTSECVQRGITLNESYKESYKAACPDETLYIFADRANIQNVFVNLLLNSIEAIFGGGAITVTLEMDKAGEKVAIAFADTGPGIPQENLDKIFSPFFTTKDEGTGLGLSICHRVVDSHKGKLSAENMPRGGAKLTVFLPARWERLMES